MTRCPAALLLAFGLAAVVAPSLVRGQPAAGGAEGAVRFRDAKKDGQETTVRGEITESTAGVKVTSGGKVLAVVTPNDIVAVEYTKLAGLDPQALKLAETKDVAKAQADYAAALKGGLTDPRSKRVAEYKVAALAARIADTKTGDDFAKEAPEAVKKLDDFGRSYQESAWEAYPAFRTAARLQTELGKHNDAANTYARLAKVKGLPADLAHDAKLDEAESLFRGGNASAAAALVTQLVGSKDFPKTGPMVDRAAVLAAVTKGGDVAPAVAAARAVIDKTTDPAVRAAAHAAVGELFLQQNRPRDAMWELLWVETVYNQDRDDVAKAVARLAEVFDKLGDKERATAYREKLPRVKQGA